MPRTLVAILTLAVVMVFAVAPLAGCDKKSEEPAKSAEPEGPKADKMVFGELTAGQSYTKALKFWMKEKSATESGLVDNLHFDDADNKRVVFFYDVALAEKADKLEQGKVYKVTFTYSDADPLLRGTATAIEE